MLCFAVAVRVASVGRTDGHAHGEQRQERGHEVGPGMRGFGEEPEAARGEPGHELETDEYDRGRDRDEGDPALGAHRPKG